MLDSKRSKQGREYCDIIVMSKNVSAWEQAMSKFYQERNYNCERKLLPNSGHQLIWSNENDNFVTLNVYPKKDKYMVQPGDRNPEKLMKWLRNFHAIKSLLTTFDGDGNDDTNTLKELFVSLAVNRIIPHYLFHIDPVKGNRHFATGIETGLKIMRSLRNKISSLATPQFAFDLPEGGGKIPLVPDYRTEEGYEAIDGRTIEYRF